MVNPYQPPAPEPNAQRSVDMGRPTIVLLAALGAWAAAAYWSALTLMIGAGVAVGSVSFAQVIMPAVLIFLYVWRGIQIFKGDPAAARRILWLHGVGGVFALMAISSGGGFVAVLHGIKVVIHIFGGVTAFLASSRRV